MTHEPRSLEPGRGALNDQYAREHALKKEAYETYQLRASIFDAPIEHLCIVVADATGRAHVPEVLFSVKNFLLQ